MYTKLSDNEEKTEIRTKTISTV